MPATDAHRRVSRAAIPGVRVIDEPRKGLVVARERGRHEASGELLVYVDADCRAPLTWLERIERRFARRPSLLALSGNYRFYDWDWWGRTLLRAYDFTLGPATHILVKYILRIGVVFYGGNFAVRRDALDRIGGFDTTHRVSRRRHQSRPAAVARSATSSCATTVSSSRRRGGTTRWERVRCSGFTCATSFRSCCITVRRTRPISTFAIRSAVGASPSFCAIDNRKPQIRYVA